MEFINKIKALLVGIKNWLLVTFGQLKTSAEGGKASASSGLKSLWNSLTFSQHCYLVASIGAVVVLYMTSGDVESYSFQFLGLLALAGITVEFWPKFLKVWESLQGRALILLFYAVVANFALGNASGLVNEVTGVSAGALPYSHNFALLLNMPVWFFITSLVALLFWQLLMPFYLFLLLLLKLFGMHGLWHPPHYRYVFTTALVRYAWSWVLFTQLWFFGHMTGIAGNEGVDADYYAQFTTELTEAIEQEEQLKQQELSAEELQIALDKIAEGKEELEVMVSRADQFYLRQKQLLAWFVFDYEADGKSRCQHPPGSKVVELNDYEILLITDQQNYDTDSEIGYQYQVLPCISPALGREFLPAQTQP
ncbi:hypothetical protein L2725_15300 [Shewanella corallii]|uniref:Uncharacterized protein n=1 Tax=Shewanella corallii TaxID=560080 RepID=A0ABT0NAF8_9GAMM|nr:hypothetical protein [Shewanella corallii]MCL2915125.1 hypothetical protein [Shewanella corallii]